MTLYWIICKKSNVTIDVVEHKLNAIQYAETGKYIVRELTAKGAKHELA